MVLILAVRILKNEKTFTTKLHINLSSVTDDLNYRWTEESLCFKTMLNIKDGAFCDSCLVG